jgi:hypothetical protein
MRYCRFLLALVLPVTICIPAPAGIIFGKHKHNAAERVPVLIATLKTSSDADKRESAAVELREYDPKAFADIVPVLMDVLQHDTSVGVRVEAAQTLGKLRPVTQEVGWALEEATKDKSIRVRLQARTSLMTYRVAGYRSEPKVVEKPMMAPSQPVVVVPQRVIVPPPPYTGPVMISGQTAPPPLAPQPIPVMVAPQPLPLGLPQPAIVPVAAPKQPQQTPPASEQGPDIK